jgi:hypothetical protein
MVSLMLTSVLRNLSVVVVSVGLLSAGCGGRHTVPLRDARAVLLPTAQDESAMRAAIARALEAQRFTAESEESGKVTAQYGKGKVQLRVKIAYTPTQFQIAYVDSEGLNYRVGPEGTPVISDKYDRIVNDLGRSISQELGRPEREAREAVAAQQRHEAGLAEAERRQQAEALAHEERERDRDRQAELERERIRAEANRPIVVQRPRRERERDRERVVVVESPAPRYVVVGARASAPPPPPPPAPTCRETLLDQGHSPASLMFCDGAEQRCAVSLLRAGHAPAHLIHCRGVEPVCAEAAMRRGQSPASLIHCR